MVRHNLAIKSVFIKKAQELGDVVNTSPEFDNAVCVLENHIRSLEKFYVSCISNVNLFYEGAKAFTLTKRCHGSWNAPIGAHWNTASRTNYLNLGKIMILVRKHGTRYLKSKVQLHDRIMCKVWSFEIFKKENGRETLYGTFIWCERGLIPIDSSSATINQYANISTNNTRKNNSKFNTIRNLRMLNQTVKDLTNTEPLSILTNVQLVKESIDNQVVDYLTNMQIVNDSINLPTDHPTNNTTDIKPSNRVKHMDNMLSDKNQTTFNQPILDSMKIEKLFGSQYINVTSDIFDSDWYDQCKKINWNAVIS